MEHDPIGHSGQLGVFRQDHAVIWAAEANPVAPITGNDGERHGMKNPQIQGSSFSFSRLTPPSSAAELDLVAVVGHPERRAVNVSELGTPARATVRTSVVLVLDEGVLNFNRRLDLGSLMPFVE